MDRSPNLDLPFIMPSQAQKHVTHNEAVSLLDAMVQLSVSTRELSMPPPSAAEGERYIIAAGASGPWTGHDGKIAMFTAGGWNLIAPRRGWLAFIEDEQSLLFYEAGSWVALADTAINPASHVGVNTVADSTNRLSVKSDAVLMSHDDVTPGTGNMRLSLNKNTEANSASLTFQTAWSARAEFGLAGDDDWHVKVSADGTVWKEAMVVDNDTGSITLPHQPAFSAYTPGAWIDIATANTDLHFDNATVNTGGHYDTANSRFIAPTDGLYGFLINGFLGDTTNGRVCFAKNGVTETKQMQVLVGAAPLSFMVVYNLVAGDKLTCRTGNVNTLLRYYQSHTTLSGWKIS